MAKYAMVIDLQKCVGCSSCITACKRENNIPKDIYWCDSQTETKGTFPNIEYEYKPTMCNHCENAPCIEACPTEAMHRNEETDMVLYDSEDCINCQQCVGACPYDEVTFNEEEPHQFWDDESSVIADGTSSPKEVVDKIDAKPPFYSPGQPLREQNLVEKCIFCFHRVVQDLNPACVDSCPADALVFGDLEDDDSQVSQLIAEHDYTVRKEEAGTKPKVYYINKFSQLKKAEAK